MTTGNRPRPARGGPSPRRFQPTSADAAQLATSLTGAGTGLQAEQFDDRTTSYLNELIPKPWGHEMRVYSDDLYDVWKLCLHPGQSTSLHCHPRKETALLCAGGHGQMTLLDRRVEVSEGDINLIGKGVFHGTANTGTTDLHLVEVEVPRNKLDLVRISDRYGRQGASYETSADRPSAALAPAQLLARSRLRQGAAIDGFQFDIQAGHDLLSRREPSLVFAVSLAVAAALAHDIDVLPARRIRTAEPEQLYLSITRTTTSTT